MKRITCCLILFFTAYLTTGLMAQDLVRDTVLTVQPDHSYHLRAGRADAIALKYTGESLARSFLLAGPDTLYLVPDPHADGQALVMLENAPENVLFFSGNLSGEVRVFFMQPGTLRPAPGANQRIQAGGCDREVVVPQTWRQGLPEPTGTPGRTQTGHLVIHHSATSNAVSDPVQVMRSIYTYHTQVNGWSDIGYNYLIAPDGTIFQGRDSKGLFDPDYTVGAHLCGVNSGTMGICLLGTYTNTLPTPEAMQSLYQLLKWKADKDRLDIFGSASHAIGPPSAGLGNRLLAVVCGHRDGCRSGYTECPGEALYQQLADVRTKTAEYRCPAEEPLTLVYPNPAGEWLQTNFAWNRVQVYDVQGRKIRTFPAAEAGVLSLRGLAKGVYLFYFSTGQYGDFVRRIVIV